MRLGTITRDPAPMTCVHTYRPKRWHWSWRKAAESLLIVLAVACVVFGLPLMLFVSCTGR